MRAEEILLDANVLAEGQKYFRLGNFAVSPDHRLLAYSTDLEGDEILHHLREESRNRRTFAGSDREHLLHARVGQR